jgi:transcriptional regulator with XRE-family HTH domain
MLLVMSQERLGESMGLTFQQVQKYEKGASRLHHISKILDVPVGDFFEEAPAVKERSTTPGLSEPESEEFVLEFLNTREGLELNRAFTKISSARVRKCVVELVRALSDPKKLKLGLHPRPNQGA